MWRRKPATSTATNNRCRITEHARRTPAGARKPEDSDRLLEQGQAEASGGLCGGRTLSCPAPRDVGRHPMEGELHPWSLHHPRTGGLTLFTEQAGLSLDRELEACSCRACLAALLPDPGLGKRLLHSQRRPRRQPPVTHPSGPTLTSAHQCPAVGVQPWLPGHALKVLETHQGLPSTQVLSEKGRYSCVIGNMWLPDPCKYSPKPRSAPALQCKRTLSPDLPAGEKPLSDRGP